MGCRGREGMTNVLEQDLWRLLTGACCNTYFLICIRSVIFCIQKPNNFTFGTEFGCLRLFTSFTVYFHFLNQALGLWHTHTYSTIHTYVCSYTCLHTLWRMLPSQLTSLTQDHMLDWQCGVTVTVTVWCDMRSGIMETSLPTIHLNSVVHV